MKNRAFLSIKRLLENHNVNYTLSHHQPTFTSQEAAKARNIDISVGGKAIVLKLDSQFAIFVLSGSKNLNSNAIKKHFKIRKLRFATKDELLKLTNLKPGSIPPFGEPIFNLDLYLDKSITKNEQIAFNAASLTDSIVMSMKDYLKLCHSTEIFDFSKD